MRAYGWRPASFTATRSRALALAPALAVAIVAGHRRRRSWKAAHSSSVAAATLSRLGRQRLHAELTWRPTRTVWVERQLELQGALEETRFRRVVFDGADRYRPHGPRWSVITHEELQDMVGATVATDRGAGYVPRPPEAEPQLVFAECAVARLARPEPFREPACMPAGVPWWHRWTRQVLPRRGARTCCWYHGGDWHAVNAMALEVLEQARVQSVEPGDMTELAVAHAASAGATRWQTEALASLFSVSDAIQPASEAGYVNGQHRAQAMLEAGVRRTVVLHHVDRT